MAVPRGQGWLPQSPGWDLVREPALYPRPAGRMCQTEHLLPGGVGGDVEERFTPVRKEIIFVLGCAGDPLVSAPAPTTTPVAVQESRAKEFLSSLRRPKRQLWDRSRPEVQQWYQHFLYLGFDEAVGVLAPSAGGVGPGRVGAGAEAWLPLVGMRVAGQRPGSHGGGWDRGLASYKAEWS